MRDTIRMRTEELIGDDNSLIFNALLDEDYEALSLALLDEYSELRIENDELRQEIEVMNES